MVDVEDFAGELFALLRRDLPPIKLRAALVNLLCQAGLRPRLLKDDEGTTFIVLDGLEEADGLSDAVKTVLRTVMAAEAQEPRGELHALH